MAGQVLDISKHENTMMASRPDLFRVSGRQARVYRFPSQLAVAQPEGGPCRRNHLRSTLAVEIAIGLVAYVIWFVCHLPR